MDGVYGGAEGAGDHAGAASVVEEGDGGVVLVLGWDVDEGEVFLDEVGGLEGGFLVPGFDIVFGSEVVEEGAVGFCEGVGLGGHFCDRMGGGGGRGGGAGENV